MQNGKGDSLHASVVVVFALLFWDSGRHWSGPEGVEPGIQTAASTNAERVRLFSTVRVGGVSQ